MSSLKTVTGSSYIIRNIRTVDPLYQSAVRRDLVHVYHAYGCYFYDYNIKFVCIVRHCYT